MSSSRRPRPDRPLVEQHEEWMAHLRRHAVSRRTVFRGAVGAATGSLLLGSSARWSDQIVGTVLADTGTIAGGFLVNGRHLSFGDDPTTQMWAGGQLFNINEYNAVARAQLRRLGLLRPVDLDELVPDDRAERGLDAVDGRHGQP